MELNQFYASHNKTNIAYYGPSAFNVGHVARKGDGNGDDCKASSKLGRMMRLGHDLNQLEGGAYRNIVGGR